MLKSRKTSVSSPHNFASSFFSFLALAFIVFIAFASLTYGNTSRENTFVSWRLSFHNIRDITTNIILYIPLGVFVSFALESSKKSRKSFLWLLLGSVVSLAMEGVQFFIGRFPDIIDLFTNSFGYIIGFWIAKITILRYNFSPLMLLGIGAKQVDQKVTILAALRFLYVSIFIVVQLLPLDISVSFTEVYNQLFSEGINQPKITLNPFFHFDQPEFDFHFFVLSFLSFLPIAIVTSLIQTYQGKLQLSHTVLFCFLFASGVEVMQVFILSQTSDIIMLPLAVFAAFFGWLGVFPFKKRTQSLSHQKHFSLLFWLIYGISLCLYAWSPYQFEFSIRELIQKIPEGVNWLPFRAHFMDRSIAGAVDIIREIGIFIPFGILGIRAISSFYPNCSRKKALLLLFLIGFFFSVFLEFSQLSCLGRYSDVTDVLLGFIGCFIGSHIGKLFEEKKNKL